MNSQINLKDEQANSLGNGDLPPKSPSTASRSFKFTSVGNFKAVSSFSVSLTLEGSSYNK